MKITIVDYGMGNIASVQNMIRHVGGDCIISSCAEEILEAQAIVLPGVGAFDNAISRLKDLKIFDVIKKKIIEDKVPFLGICLGMQLLFESSEEGELNGLGVFKGEVSLFDKSKMVGLKIPHMGWNIVDLKKENELINLSEYNEQRFYFVHSFHVNVREEDVILGTCHYGYDFVCSVNKDNIYAVQFHPEKSHKFGMSLFKNFIRICQC